MTKVFRYKFIYDNISIRCKHYNDCECLYLRLAARRLHSEPRTQKLFI